VDLLIVRDNTGGVYQGQWGDRATDKGRFAEHSFSYSEAEVHRLVEVAARAAACRKGKLHIIVKEGGIPTVTALWRDVGGAVACRHGVKAAFMNVDLAAYELIQNPAQFDVIAAPNLFGDILADVTGVLVSSRGVTFSGNFDAHGHGATKPIMVAPTIWPIRTPPIPPDKSFRWRCCCAKVSAWTKPLRLSKNPSPQPGARAGALPTSPSRAAGFWARKPWLTRLSNRFFVRQKFRSLHEARAAAC
jgi:hypothetical protein